MSIRNVDDIVPPSRRERVSVSKEDMPQPPVRERAPKRSPRRGNMVSILLGAVVFLLVAVGVLYLTSASKVVVYPASYQGPVDTTVPATKDTLPGMVRFEVLELERLGSETVSATGSEQTEERASGTITVINDHSTTPQRLIKNTRFETPDGKIYRIQESIVVPGKTTSNPGSLDVTVYADVPGEEYNAPSGLTFTLPGLKGTEQFTKITARQKGSIAGGFRGVRATASEADIASAKKAIQERLLAELRDLSSSSIPAGFILLPGASQITFESLPVKAASEGMATVEEKGVMRAIIFENESLARALAEVVVGTYEGEPITLINDGSLKLVSLTQDQFSLSEATFSFSGNASLVYQLDPSDITRAIQGQSRESVERIIDEIPGIERADVTLRPFWRSVFPDSDEGIEVVVKTANE